MSEAVAWLIALALLLFAGCAQRDARGGDVPHASRPQTESAQGLPATPTATQPTPSEPAAPSPAPTLAPSPPPEPASVTGGETPTVMFGDERFPAELAITPSQRARGLSGRESLEPGTGMLFIFENRSASSFWMIEMRFPLDFVWIGEDCRVVDVTANAPHPAPGTQSTQLPRYESEFPAAYNFEINAGEAGARGIQRGVAVRFSGIPEEVGETCD